MRTSKAVDVIRDNGAAAPAGAVGVEADAQPEGCKLGRELGDCPLRRSGCGSLYDVLGYLMPPGHVREYIRARLGEDPAAAGIDPDAKIAPSAPPVPRETIQTQAQTIGNRKDKRHTPTQKERERWAEFKRHLAAARAAWPEIVAWCEMTGTSYAAAVWDADALVDLYMLYLADSPFHSVPNIVYAGTVGA